MNELHEKWVNVYEFDLDDTPHPTREDALDALVQRAERSGDDRVREYVCTMHMLHEGRRVLREHSVDLAEPADEILAGQAEVRWMNTQRPYHRPASWE